MSRTLILTSEAVEDITEILDWYRDQKKGLENDFVFCLEVALHQVKENPLSFQIRSKGYRAILLHRFPYKVAYKVYDNEIRIYGVFHHSRNPKTIRKRLK